LVLHTFVKNTHATLKNELKIAVKQPNKVIKNNTENTP